MTTRHQVCKDKEGYEMCFYVCSNELYTSKYFKALSKYSDLVNGVDSGRRKSQFLGIKTFSVRNVRSCSVRGTKQRLFQG